MREGEESASGRAYQRRHERKPSTNATRRSRRRRSRPDAGLQRARWSPDEDRYLVEHWQDPARDLAMALGRSLYAIRQRWKKLRSRLDRPAPRRHWREP